MSDSTQTTTGDQAAVLANPAAGMSREELRKRIAEFKQFQDQEKQFLENDKKPLVDRKAELEKEIAEVVNDRKAELDELQKKVASIQGEIDEATKDLKSELNQVNTEISEIDKQLNEIGVSTRTPGVRKARTGTSGGEGYKARIGTPQWDAYLNFVKQQGHFSSKRDMMSKIKAAGLGGVNEAGTMFSGNANYVWIGLRKEGYLRENDDGSIDYTGK